MSPDDFLAGAVDARTARREHAKARARASMENPNERTLLLDPKNPFASAQAFVKKTFWKHNQRTLHFNQGNFYSWTGTYYRELTSDQLRALLYKFLHRAKNSTDSDEFKPDSRKVSDVIDALRAVCHVEIVPPTWLSGEVIFNPAETISCANGLLHVPTRKLIPHTPAFFNLTSLPFDYDAQAVTATAWHKFLDELWPDDIEAINTLQELFGYLLTPDTRQQKIFLIVGPPRSGKGTIAKILTALFGSNNVATPTLSGLSTNFGLAPLIGKSLAIIPDARIGSRVDQQFVAEVLLSISGEDSQTIDRKYLSPWTGHLSARLVIFTNELPRIADNSGALASRMIILTLTNSFVGREDKALASKLLTELSGILNFAIEGWDRLSTRGHFIQPGSSEEAVGLLMDLSSPIGSFVHDECEIGNEFQTTIEALYSRWRDWCVIQGREHPGTLQTFCRDLLAHFPSLRKFRPRATDGSRNRLYSGIRLR